MLFLYGHIFSFVAISSLCILSSFSQPLAQQNAVSAAEKTSGVNAMTISVVSIVATSFQTEYFKSRMLLKIRYKSDCFRNLKACVFAVIPLV